MCSLAMHGRFQSSSIAVKPTRHSMSKKLLMMLSVALASLVISACASGTDNSNPSTSASSTVTGPTTRLSTTTPTTVGPVQILNLKEGDPVEHTQEVRAVAAGFPDGVEFWVVVQPLLAPQYHPQPGPVARSADGQFLSVAYFGESALKASGEKFILLIVSASSTGGQAFRNYLSQAKSRGTYPGLPGLPAGTQPTAQITVVRK